MPAIAARISNLVDGRDSYAAVAGLRTLNVYLLIAVLRELVVRTVHIYGVPLIRGE